MKEALMMMGGGVMTDGLTAQAAHVRAGDTFYGAGSDDEQTGTLVDRSIAEGLTVPAHEDCAVHQADAVYAGKASDGTVRVMLAPPVGDYPGGENGAYVGALPSALGVTASKIASGQTAAGVAGTYDANGTVSASDMKAGIVAYSKGKKVTGKQTDYGNINQTLAAGKSYTIKEGFYGAGKIAAASLASQTSGTAKAAQIKSGLTAWVNGAKVTGTAKDYGSVTKELAAGGSYTIGEGFYGAGKITAKSLASQQSAIVNAFGITADKIVTGNAIAGVAGTAPYIKIGDKWLDNKTFNYPNTTKRDFDNLDEDHGNWFLKNYPPANGGWLVIRVSCGTTDEEADGSRQMAWCTIGTNTWREVVLRPNYTADSGNYSDTVRLDFYRSANGDLYYHPMKGSKYGVYTTSIVVLAQTSFDLSQWS